MEENNNTSHTVQGSDVYILGQKGKDGREWQLTPDGLFWMYRDEGQDWVVTDIPARGEKGEPMAWDDLTPEQKESLKGDKGDKGDPLTFDELTPEQKEELKGEKGDKGDKGDPLPYSQWSEEDALRLVEDASLGLESAIQQAIIQSNANFVPVSGNILPSPSTNNNFTILGEDAYTGVSSIPEDPGFIRIAAWNGADWSVIGKVSSGKSSTKIIMPNPGNVSIPDNEHIIGTYTDSGAEMPIYSSTFRLDDLPVQAGLTKEYILSDEPLGYGLFLNIAKTTISSGKNILGVYFNAKYRIDNIYVNNDFKTVLSIRCTENVDSEDPVYMLLNLEYLKYDGNVVEFTVNVPEGVNAESINLNFPKLKFNKKFAFSYITDDSNSIYQFLFSGINKRWVANTMLFYLHLNFPIAPHFSDGFMPEYPLEFTDGAGNMRRFATSIAVWPDKLVNTNGTIGSDVGMNWPWMSEKEFKLYKDFGYSVLYHDLNGYTSADVNQENFNTWFENTKAKFLQYINDSPKIIAEPNGDHRYLALSQSIGDIVMNTAQSGDPLIKKAYLYRPDFTLDKSVIAPERYFGGETNYYDNLYNILNGFDTTNDLNSIYWLIGATHRNGIHDYNFFKRINDDFGSIGSDNMWFASIDEFYEYWYLTNNATVIKTVNGDEISFKLYFPKMPRFWFNEVSCLLSDITTTDGVSVTSNTDGLSYGINGNNLLVNLNFNKDLITKAEKYTSAFENNPNGDYLYDDAMYMVNQLKPSLRTPFLNRLNVYSSAPTFTDFQINNGASETPNNQVSLTFNFTGVDPTHYMVSETSDFSGSNWITYSSPVNYALSSGYGIKQIYVKLKNIYGESSVLSRQIAKIKPELVLNSITVAEQVSSSPVPVTFNFSGIPTHYRLSPTNDFTGVEWIAFTSNQVDYTLGLPYGQKTVFAQLRDEVEDKVSSIVSSSFEYVDSTSAILSSIEINDGNESTSSGNVTVKLNTVNTITHYRIGQQSDLSAISWIPYTSNTVNYNSGINSGTLTVYAQVKNNSNDSQVRSDSINIIEPVSLTSMAIADGATSFAGLSPKVEFTITSGTPTHYRLAETSSGLSSASWLPWAENINFTFSTIGTKTLYGQVKNAISDSNVVNDSITLTTPPVAVLLGFNGTSNNTNTKIVTSGLTTNQINRTPHSTYSDQQLVDTTGQVVPGVFFNLKATAYEANEIFNASNTYENTSSNATVPSGIYSVDTIRKVIMTQQNAGGGNLTRKARFSFTLPVGTYRFRILWNTSNVATSVDTENKRINSFYAIYQGTTELVKVVSTPSNSITGLNNQDFNAEMEFTISDGSTPVDLGLWSLVGGGLPGVNLVEITKIS